MPINSIRLVPGVNIEKTPALNEAGYSYSSFGRFRDGLFQKVGGWKRYYPYSVAGIPRSLHAWQDLNAVKHLALGTTAMLSVFTSGSQSTITPQTVTSDFAPNFSTTAGSSTIAIVDANINNVTVSDSIYFNTPISVGGIILSGLYAIASIGGAHSYSIVAAGAATTTVSNGGTVPSFSTTLSSATITVTFPNHGLAVGGSFVVPIATLVGGVTVAGSYTVASVPGANAFTIVSPSAATSTATASMNSGNAELVYYIALAPQATGTGYGVGAYGAGGYGSGIVPSSQTGSPISATDWTTDNWGELLVSCPENGGVYYWGPNSGLQNSCLISTGPIFNTGIFMAMPQQQIVAYGSTPGNGGISVGQDPLLVRWCDAGNFFQWTAASTNQAGSYRIPTGSKIVGGMQANQKGLLWTDIDLWAMSYINYPLVYGFNKIGSNCGLVGKHAATQMGGAVYWMGPTNFYVYGGSGAEPIPCSVWDAVFQDFDTANQRKCVAASNSSFNEVWFFYPSLSGGSGECDSYAKLNVSERTWDIGHLGRSAWIDQSVLGAPIAASPQSIIYQHESGYDNDGSPISTVMQTGYFMVSEGWNKVTVDMVWPDFKWGPYSGQQSAQISLTFYGVDYPGETPSVDGPHVVTQATDYINLRLRKKMIALRAESSDLGSFWRIGNIRLRYAADGRV